MESQSSMVRNPKMPSFMTPSALFRPFIGGMKARLPVAISSTSYRARVPSADCTMRDARSIPVTFAPRCRAMPFSSYHETGLMKISLLCCTPLSTLDSMIRL